MRRILLSLPSLLLSPQMGGGLGPVGGYAKYIASKG